LKNYLIAAASTVALAVAMPAVANAAPAGYIGATYSDSNDLDASAWGVNGAAVIPAGSLNLQFDAGASRVDVGSFDDDSAAAAVHLFHRDDSFALGAFVGAADQGIYNYGVEGAIYASQMTFSGQVGKIEDQSASGGGDGTAWALGAKFFATDNFSLGVNYSSFDPKGSGGSFDVWGAGVEYKPMSMPVSFSLGYARNDDFDVDAWSIGARWHFGVGSLKEQDRKGASMGTSTGFAF
jgi:hypothetical protein